ncbi:histidine N-acetyltransferase [Branchiostoma belcheri]|nr:histidine N-acetyltransferase [Branchiostoma belcheri]
MQRCESSFDSTERPGGGYSQDVAIRLARHNDYSAILRISEGLTAYFGTDYVPAKFHAFVDDPDVMMFLAEVGDQVVGMTASKFTEGGRVFISKAARVAPDWRGQGIITKLSLHRDAWIRQNRPTVKCMRVTALSLSPTAEHFHTTKRHIFSLPFVSYQCGPGLWWRQDPAQLAQLEPTGLPDVVPLQDADDDFCTAVQKWLPAGACGGYDGKPIILVDWDPDVLNMDELHKPGLQAVLFESEL